MSEAEINNNKNDLPIHIKEAQPRVTRQSKNVKTK